MTEAVSESEDFDFMGDSSMKDLAMRMGDIDKQLDEINEIEKKSNDSSPQKDTRALDDQMLAAQFEDSRTSIVSDVVLDDDDEALEDLQGELKEFEAMQKEAALAASPNNPPSTQMDTVSATVLKTSPTSPIGISMKTVQGVTRIVSIAENGLLASTALKPGFIIHEINGVNIKNAKHARYMIENAPEKVTIVTQVVMAEF
jgi:C-terminal processing protease CtpA/Prc